MKTEFDLSWFDLTKYEPLQNFNLEDWFIQLSNRLEINMFFRVTPPMIEKLGKDISRKKHLEAVENLKSIKINPILKYPLKSDNSFTSWKLAKGLQPPSVRDVTFDEMELEKIFRDTIGEKTRDFFDEFNGLAGVKVYVDLNATDNQIKENFNSWLKNKRKVTERNVSKRCFTEIDFSRWEKHKILPYIDLKLIAHSEGKTLTQSKIGDLLFSSDKVIERPLKVRKTVKPLAEKLLTTKTICAMQSQIR